MVLGPPGIRQDGATVPPEPPDIEAFARAAAGAAGLEIADEWWPGVVAHLEIMLTRAASLEAMDGDLPEDSAPVFQP